MSYPSRLPENRKQYNKAYYERNRVKVLERNRVYLQANPDKRKEYGRRGKLKEKYGISAAQYDAKHEAQNGKCAICEQAETRRALSTDHNHITGQVRELLCSRCNFVLGLVNEDIDLAMRMINYLQKWQIIGKS